MRTLALVFALSAVLGCGYRTGMVVGQAGETVGVEFFANDSPLPDLERIFHGFVTDALNRTVHARLVPPERSDLIVRGRVTAYARQGGIRSEENVLLERGLRVSVEARLVRRSHDPDGAEREEVLSSGTFASEGGFRTVEPEGELDARDRILRRIADRMVLDLFGPLAYQNAP